MGIFGFTQTDKMFYQYFQLGWDHIIEWEALDHILFILALCAVYTLKDWKQVLVLVTAFTIGHSVTLALSVLNLVHISSFRIELLIPCTILLTVIFNLFQKKFSPKSLRINYFLALFFGLIHGLGFANGLKSMLGPKQTILIPLLGFNLGLEAGQIVVVIFILLAGWIAFNALKINRREWVVFLSGAAFSVSLNMILQRIV